MTDEQSLRIRAAKLLQPKPWKHNFKEKASLEGRPGYLRLRNCSKCGMAYSDTYRCSSPESPDICPHPDPDDRHMAIITDELLLNAIETYGPGESRDRIAAAIEERCGQARARSQFAWWLCATPAERAEVCLRVLEEKT